MIKEEVKSSILKMREVFLFSIPKVLAIYQNSIDALEQLPEIEKVLNKFGITEYSLDVFDFDDVFDLSVIVKIDAAHKDKVDEIVDEMIEKDVVYFMIEAEEE